MDSNTLKIIGKVRAEIYNLTKAQNLYVKFLRFFNRGRIGAQSIGRYINYFVKRYGVLQLDTGFGDNIITSVGKAAIAGLAGNTGAVTAFSYVAVGTSSSAVSASDTTLGAEITDTGLARTTATVSRVTTTTTNDTLQFAYTWSASGTKTVQEFGVFNASSAGVMLNHYLTGALALVNTNTLVVTYKVIFV